MSDGFEPKFELHSKIERIFQLHNKEISQRWQGKNDI